MASGSSIVFVFASLAFFSSFVEIHSMPKENSKYEGGCVDNGGKHNEGDTWPGPIGQCATYVCGANGSIMAKSCGAFLLAPGSTCSMSEYDFTVPYPDCCPKAVCPKD